MQIVRQVTDCGLVSYDLTLSEHEIGVLLRTIRAANNPNSFTAALTQADRWDALAMSTIIAKEVPETQMILNLRPNSYK